MTKRERNQIYFEQHGYKQDKKAKTSKYLVYSYPKDQVERKYFLGVMGGIRMGKTVSDSISVGHIMMPRIEAWFRKKFGGLNPNKKELEDK